MDYTIKTSPKSGENVWLWLLKIVTGLLIIVLLFAHLVVNHTVVEGGLLTYADVARYYSNPWIVLMEAAFLTFVVSHTLIGLRSVILDLRPSRAVLAVLDWVFVVVGVGFVVYGLWIIRSIVVRGTVI